MSTRHREQGSRFRRDVTVPSRVRTAAPAGPTRTRNPVMTLIGFGLVAAVFVNFFFSTQQDPITFGLTTTEFSERWNAAADESPFPELRIRSLQWTDEEAGVLGFAFTESTSVIARVDRVSRILVEEIAVIGRPSTDGEALVTAAMELVIRVTEPELDRSARIDVLTELAVLGTLPADPDQRTGVGSTEYRVAADAENGIVGVGARPIP